MEPLLLLLAGGAALVAGFLTLQSFGPGYRIGRILATTPRVTIAEAIASAHAGTGEYVRVEGRIDSEHDFLDENGRPLVFRRARLEVRRLVGWQRLDEQREAVPFSVRQGLDEIGVVADDLDEGVVGVPRESTGAAGEVPERVPSGTDPSARLRYRVDLVSSIDHASVLGVPRRDGGGGAVMASGLGRPLIVSILPDDEAMRILAGGRRARSIAAASLLAAGCVLVLGAAAWTLVRAVA